MKRALFVTFMIGVGIGLLREEYPWRGEGIIVNASYAIGSGIGLMLFPLFVWGMWSLVNWLSYRADRNSN